jgi:hypothetical protein
MPSAVKLKEPRNAIPIDEKRAVEIASRYFHEFFPTTGGVMLEEIEEGDDGKCWLITLGYDVKTKPPFARGLDLRSYSIHRDYKTLKIDNTTGRVCSMKMRKL